MLKARVKNRDKEPEDHATVQVSISYPIPVKKEGPEGREIVENGTTVRLEPVPLSLGEYQTHWLPPATGLYEATVRAEDEAGELGADRFEFVVGHAASEFDRVDVDDITLRSVASQTGGTYHTLVTAGRIPDELEQRRRLVLHHEEINFWNRPWFSALFFMAFLACVTTEWVLRKRRGLKTH